MVLIFFLVPLIAAICSAEYNYILSDEFINDINNKQSLWKAGRNFDPNTPLNEIRSLLGFNTNFKSKNKDVKTIDHDVDEADLPEFFDARKNWPNCKSIKEIADQSACGSCWAVSVASAISDRICIATNGTNQVSVSASNILSCCKYCGKGCNGGVPIDAWLYWLKPGIVSGGLYNTTMGCQNYPFPSCEHHTTGSRPACPSTLYDTPKCSHICDASWNKSYVDSFTYGKEAFYINDSAKSIQEDIMQHGPVTAGFTVYSDFLSYKSGIYQHVSGNAEKSVRIIGWGVENNVKYWIIANSWNPDWGENGTFRIIRGENHCEIEQHVTAGLALLI